MHEPVLLLLALTVVLVVESGLLVGLAVPGTTLTLGAGAVARFSDLPLPAAVAAAAGGVVIGGQVAYRLGRRRRALPVPFAGVGARCVPVCVALAARLRRRPLLALVGGPWLSSGRLAAPRLAGWVGVPSGRFTLAHAPSATGWAATLVVAGYLGGPGVRDHVAGALGVAAVLAPAVLLARARRRAVRAGDRAASVTRGS